MYYYQKGSVYAIFDIKNVKLYYLKNNFYNVHKDYNNICGIDIRNFSDREIYDVRGGPQNDGRDYYVYKFTKEIGNKIAESLEQNSKWSKNKLDNSKLDCFEYTNEIQNIKTAYYYYELAYRTNNENKNLGEKDATGFEIGVYDVDNNVLYYYWESI